MTNFVMHRTYIIWRYTRVTFSMRFMLHPRTKLIVVGAIDCICSVILTWHTAAIQRLSFLKTWNCYRNSSRTDSNGFYRSTTDQNGIAHNLYKVIKVDEGNEAKLYSELIKELDIPPESTFLVLYLTVQIMIDKRSCDLISCKHGRVVCDTLRWAKVVCLFCSFCFFLVPFVPERFCVVPGTKSTKKKQNALSLNR